MSRKGNCWDSAPSETLFASLKVGSLHGQHFQTIRQAKDESPRLAAPVPAASSVLCLARSDQILISP